METALFCYGTLQFPEVMLAVSKRTFTAAPATLPDYIRRRLRNRVFPGICPQPGETTSGVLYGQVDQDSLRLLDRFEADFYHRRTLSVITVDGTAHPAEAYVLTPDNRHLMTTRPWQPEHFRLHDLERYLRGCCL